MFDANSEEETFTTKPKQRTKNKSSTGCVPMGIVILLISFGLCGALVGALSAISPNLMNQVLEPFTGSIVPETRPVPGDAAHFDPVASFNTVKEFAGEGFQLISLSATNVRADGTLDLTATYSPAPRATYKFRRLVERPTNAPPVGAGGTGQGSWYEPLTVEAFQPGQRRRVTRSGGGVSMSTMYVNEGMTRDVDDPTTSVSGEPISAPKCSFADLWQEALKQDVPKDAVAAIDYDSSGYRFSIGPLGVFLHFDVDCNPVDS